MSIAIPVLLYHDVGPPAVGGYQSLSVSAARFERQMRYLAEHGWSSLTLEQYCGVIDGHLPPSPKSVLITFDDGFSGLIDQAAPILATYGLHATIFVVTGCLGGTANWTGEDPLVRRPTLDRDHIARLVAMGLDFGAHSISHRNLTTLDSAEVEEEIAGSIDQLAAITGRKVWAFAYPYGAMNEMVRAIAAKYAPLAFATTEGLSKAGVDRWALPRTMVQPLNPHLDFRAQLRLGYSPVEALRRFRRRIP